MQNVLKICILILTLEKKNLHVWVQLWSDKWSDQNGVLLNQGRNPKCVFVVGPPGKGLDFSYS